MRYGYIRDSKNNETFLQKQREHLHNFNLDTIIKEPRGISFGEGFQTLLENLKPGDELYIDHVSRITRNKSDFLIVLDILIEKNITLYESGNLVNLKDMKTWLENKDNLGGGYTDEDEEYLYGYEE